MWDSLCKTRNNNMQSVKKTNKLMNISDVGNRKEKWFTTAIEYVWLESLSTEAEK